MEQVLWRPIKGYEELYEVSSNGKVRSLDRVDRRNHFRKGRLLKEQHTHNGYARVILSKNGIVKGEFVHRLVAFAFPEICGEWFDGAEVNHKNEEKMDNRAKNLEWCNRLYNANYGTGNKRNGEHRINHKDLSKPVAQCREDGEVICVYPSISEAFRQTGICLAHISQCCANKRKTAGGFIWKYE